MGAGYVLDFNNKGFKEFFEDQLGIDIYSSEYATRGNSKVNRLRCFIENSSRHDVVQVLEALWELAAEETRNLIEIDNHLISIGAMDLELTELKYAD
ncbi:hypothetical protein M1105_13340 [Limibaculum sp. FT325]|uniref:hypothetical protein n=1 Tax=Thermohalobaculum sediminis TaxID=2939436 RepID=UPI0020C0967B|nr:hypothetical protein [Limibaculum sediminis]MCL5777967.1 hypothetical protein [Limibaculum sediminis]